MKNIFTSGSAFVNQETGSSPMQIICFEQKTLEINRFYSTRGN